MGLLVIGVTGGTGSGKSTVSRFLSEMGAEIIDTDAISRELTGPGSEMLKEMVKYFGGGILNSDGSLNRRLLGEIAFKDKEKLSVLNDISHKRIAEEIITRVNAAKQENRHGIIVIDAPVPIKHGFLDVVDEVWVVVSDEDARLRRVMDRSGLSKEQATSIISSQMSQDEYLKLADEVILNDSDLETLKKGVSAIYSGKLGTLV